MMLISDAQLEEASTWQKLPWRRARLMVVGEGRAGKTSLLRSLRGEPFTDTASTQGLEMHGCLLDRDNVLNSDWSSADKGATEYARAVGAKLLVCSELPSTGSMPTTAPDVEATRMEESESITPGSDMETLANKASAPDPSRDRPERSPREASDERGLSRMRRLDKGLVASCMRDGVHQQVLISVWDYAGQELFDAMHQLFLSQQGVYLVVFSMSALQADKESVLQRLRFWLDSLRLHAPSAPLLLVGTHGDQVQDPEARRQLSSLLQSRLKLQKRPHGLCFFPVDNTLSGGGGVAGAADPGVAQLRTQINAMVLEHEWQGKKFIDYPVPAPYFRVCDRLCSLQAELAGRAWLQRLQECVEHLERHGPAEKAQFLGAMSAVQRLARDPEVPPALRKRLLAAPAPYAALQAKLSGARDGTAADAGVDEATTRRAARHGVATLEEMTRLARECGLGGGGRWGDGVLAEEVRTMLKLFHRLGLLLYFDEVPALQELVVLDPQWLIDVVVAVTRDFELHPRPCDTRLERHCDLQESWRDLKDRGLLHSSLLKILWSSEGGVDPAPTRPEEQAGLLTLLQQFGLLCKLDDPRPSTHGADACGRYLVPCLLPKGEEEGEGEDEALGLVPGARFDIDFDNAFLTQPFFQLLVVRALQRGQKFAGGHRDPIEHVRRHCAELSFGDHVDLRVACPLGACSIRVDVLTPGEGACAAALKEVEVLVDGLDLSVYHGALFRRAALGVVGQGTPLCSSVAERIVLQRSEAPPEEAPQVSLAALRRAIWSRTLPRRYTGCGRVEAVHFEHWQLKHALFAGSKNAAGPASESCAPRALLAGCRHHFFVAHKDTTGGDQVVLFCGELERSGWTSSYYNYLNEDKVVTEGERLKGRLPLVVYIDTQLYLRTCALQRFSAWQHPQSRSSKAIRNIHVSNRVPARAILAHNVGAP
ncbi:hypothetical protein CYMTET_42159 [Cymbomonas tetramitiformis]|uniref:non-specific serine/threonine protein kinase n=1 Tax=Cymbomonas tetramitiformis TaxID=36881 RepID=A0AAE0C4Q3_9CHLO|nr:hypothetical protein CYMTET_42159 [Cymbomonas tetramitiformis]